MTLRRAWLLPLAGLLPAAEPIPAAGKATAPPAAPAPAAATSAPVAAPALPDSPAVNWVLPIFSDQEGHRLMKLQGNEVRPIDGRVAITNLMITTFTGDARATVDSILLSPRAVFSPKDHTARGEQTDTDFNKADITFQCRHRAVAMHDEFAAAAQRHPVHRSHCRHHGIFEHLCRDLELLDEMLDFGEFAGHQLVGNTDLPCRLQRQ